MVRYHYCLLHASKLHPIYGIPNGILKAYKIHKDSPVSFSWLSKDLNQGLLSHSQLLFPLCPNGTQDTIMCV